MSDRHDSGLPRDRQALDERAILVIGTTTASRAPAIADAAGARGARVVLVTPDTDTLDFPSRVTSALESEAAIDRVFDAALDRLSRLDVVVVVLVVPAVDALHTLSLERWRERIALPLRTTFWLAQRALDEFLGSGEGGRLIFVVDRPGGDTAGDGVRIVAEAITSLARSLAREYGRRAVSCQVVVRADDDRNTPSGVEPQDPVVECVLFLASSAASFVTGEVVTVGCLVAAPASMEPRTP
jgi:NAD(P)-dependent dehydrogenase (short-subunit alcohol dehydrogenase family)